MAKEENDVVEVVLRLKVEKQGWVAMLLEDGRRRHGCLEAMRLPVPDCSAKRPQGLSCPFPIVGEGPEKLLYLPRRPVLPDDGPLLGPKVLSTRNG